MGSDVGVGHWLGHTLHHGGRHQGSRGSLHHGGHGGSHGGGVGQVVVEVVVAEGVSVGRVAVPSGVGSIGIVSQSVVGIVTVVVSKAVVESISISL